MPENFEPLDLSDVRKKLGIIWGLDRTITKEELARACGLSDKNGGDYIGRIEKGKVKFPGGALDVAIRMMLAGAKPHTMERVIKPGYPRGEVKV